MSIEKLPMAFPKGRKHFDDLLSAASLDSAARERSRNVLIRPLQKERNRIRSSHLTSRRPLAMMYYAIIPSVVAETPRGIEIT